MEICPPLMKCNYCNQELHRSGGGGGGGVLKRWALREGTVIKVDLSFSLMSSGAKVAEGVRWSQGGRRGLGTQH